MKKLNVLLVMSMITMMSLVGCKKPTPKPSDIDVASESSAPDIITPVDLAKVKTNIENLKNATMKQYVGMEETGKESFQAESRRHGGRRIEEGSPEESCAEESRSEKSSTQSGRRS